MLQRDSTFLYSYTDDLSIQQVAGNKGLLVESSPSQRINYGPIPQPVMVLTKKTYKKILRARSKIGHFLYSDHIALMPANDSGKCCKVS